MLFQHKINFKILFIINKKMIVRWPRYRTAKFGMSQIWNPLKPSYRTVMNNMMKRFFLFIKNK